MKAPSVIKAVQMFYQSTEMGNSEIMELFNTSKVTAQKLKGIAKELMIEEGKKCMTPNAVLTEVAYRAWGMDIAVLEKQLCFYYTTFCVVCQECLRILCVKYRTKNVVFACAL